MDDRIFNSTMATSVALTQAQIVTTAVIGSILLTLVVLNIVMYSIYKRLMQEPKVTIKLGKQETIQLYQMKSTMEYNTSSSSVNQSNCRTLRTTSYSGEETMSVNYSSADVTTSFSHNRSMCSSTVPEPLELETSLEYQVSTSGTNRSWKERKQLSNKIIEESSIEKLEQESTDSLETEAQIHDNRPQNSNKPQRLSDIHLYQCIKSQINQHKMQSDITHENQKTKPVPGIERESPLEENCLHEKSQRKKREKKSKELQGSHHRPQRSEIPQNNVQDKSQRTNKLDTEEIPKGNSASQQRHHKSNESESKHPRNSREHANSKCSRENDNPPSSQEHNHTPSSRECGHSRRSGEHGHSTNSREHTHSNRSKEHAHPQSFRIQNEIKGYVDMADFDNDTDTEASVLAALDSVQTYQGVQLLTSGEGLMGCPVVEFQNKAFEFSETKTSLEVVDDTDL